MVPAVRSSYAAAPELIEEARGGGIDGDADAIRSGFPHGSKRRFVTDQGGCHQDADRQVRLFLESANDMKRVLNGSGVGDHGNADAVNLVLSPRRFDDLIQAIERPVYSDECLPPGGFTPGPGKAAEVTSSQATFPVMEQEVESGQLGVPVKQALLKAKGEGSGEGGLDIMGADF
jgi:hypothetical protein